MVIAGIWLHLSLSEYGERSWGFKMWHRCCVDMWAELILLTRQIGAEAQQSAEGQRVGMSWRWSVPSALVSQQMYCSNCWTESLRTSIEESKPTDPNHVIVWSVWLYVLWFCWRTIELGSLHSSIPLLGRWPRPVKAVGEKCFTSETLTALRRRVWELSEKEIHLENWWRAGCISICARHFRHPDWEHTVHPNINYHSD